MLPMVTHIHHFEDPFPSHTLLFFLHIPQSKFLPPKILSTLILIKFNFSNYRETIALQASVVYNN